MTVPRQILHIDPAIGSRNLGDDVISQAVRSELRGLFPDTRIFTTSSRDYGRNAQELARDCEFAFLGGTNALSADPVFGYRQILTDRFAAFRMRDIVLLGVGWWQYQDRFGRLAKRFYADLLRDDVMHSVRDAHTKQMLARLGVTNVINTGCPTMWSLQVFEAVIPTLAVITLTDYNQQPDRDLSFLRAVHDRFDDVVYWPQGELDRDYLRKLEKSGDLPEIRVLTPSVQALDEALAEGRCFLGTRLHASIRSLKAKKPAFLIPIDNRATEIARHDALPLISPDLSDVIPGKVFTYRYTRRPEIDQFLLQFQTR